MTFFEQVVNFFASAKGELASAGAAGAAVSAIMEWSGIGAFIRRMVVGTLTAMFLGPLAVPFLEWALSGINVPRENSASMGGFIIGVSGIVIIEIITKAFKLRLRSMNGGKDDS